MASIFYNQMKGRDGLDWAAGLNSDYKCMLVTSSYTPNPDHSHPSASGLASNEITGGGYARQNMASRTKTVNNTTDTYDHLASNLTFTLITGAPKYAIIYKAYTSDADHLLVCAVDLGSQSLTGQDFIISWTSGVVFQGT